MTGEVCWEKKMEVLVEVLEGMEKEMQVEEYLEGMEEEMQVVHRQKVYWVVLEVEVPREEARVVWKGTD